MTATVDRPFCVFLVGLRLIAYENFPGQARVLAELQRQPDLDLMSGRI